MALFLYLTSNNTFNLNIFFNKKMGIRSFMPIKNNINFGYHAHGPTFAFFKEYLESNKHDDQAELGEESMFTHNFTSPLIQLNPLK